MKAQYNVTIEDFETKVDGIPGKVGSVSINCSGEHSWFDVLCFSRIFKTMPKWLSKMYAVVVKMDQK